MLPLGGYPVTSKKLHKEGVSGGGALMMGGVGGIIGGAAVGLGSMAVSAGMEKARERMELQKMSDLVGADSNQVAAMVNWGGQTVYQVQARTRSLITSKT